jgi:hypothetical protein
VRIEQEWRVVADGGRNPLVIVSADQVKKWLREIADAAGYGDRATCAFQLNVETDFYEKNYHAEAPSLTIMVSNIPNSRQK